MLYIATQIHSVDVETAGLSDYGKHGEYVGRQVKTWTRQYEASKTGEIPSMDKVREEKALNLFLPGDCMASCQYSRTEAHKRCSW